MQSKYKYLIALVVVVVLIIVYNLLPKGESGRTALDENGKVEEVKEDQDRLATTKTPASPTTKASTATKATATNNTSGSKTSEPRPEIEFVDKRISLNPTNYTGVKITVEKVALGRGDAAISTGCQGVPNTNFSAYLYPGNSVCIGSPEVDGKPRAILALHVLIENNSNINFGGNANTIKIHYKRADSTGTLQDKNAYALTSLANYNIPTYSSKNLILSYLVPEDQVVFDVLIDHKDPSVDSQNKDFIFNSKNVLFIDFLNKAISIVK